MEEKQMENAQAELSLIHIYLGHKWCNYWFHVHHLNDKSGKMSKSKGDFLTVSLLEEKGYLPLVYRMFCLQSHYRTYDIPCLLYTSQQCNIAVQISA